MLERVRHYLKQVNGFAVALMMFTMFVLVFYNVVARYIVGRSLPWTEEVARFLMIWITYLGIGLALVEGRLVAIEVLHSMFPKRWLPYIRGFIGLIILVFMGYLMVLGFRYAAFAHARLTPVLRMSYQWVYLAIPIGSLGLLLHLLTSVQEYLVRASDDGPDMDIPFDPPVGGGVSR